MVQSKDNQPQSGEKYRHYKGGEYLVIAVGKMESDGQVVVIYQSFIYKEVWVRPLISWMEVVEKEGVKIPRFTRID